MLAAILEVYSHIFSLYVPFSKSLAFQEDYQLQPIIQCKFISLAMSLSQHNKQPDALLKNFPREDFPLLKGQLRVGLSGCSFHFCMVLAYCVKASVN